MCGNSIKIRYFCQALSKNRGPGRPRWAAWPSEGARSADADHVELTGGRGTNGAAPGGQTGLLALVATGTSVSRRSDCRARRERRDLSDRHRDAVQADLVELVSKTCLHLGQTVHGAVRRQGHAALETDVDVLHDLDDHTSITVAVLEVRVHLIVSKDERGLGHRQAGQGHALTDGAKGDDHRLLELTTGNTVGPTVAGDERRRGGIWLLVTWQRRLPGICHNA